MPISLTLHPHAIGTSLGSEDGANAPQINPSDGCYVWLDSSLELQRGLDVLELTVEVVLPDLPAHTEKERTR